MTDLVIDFATDLVTEISIATLATELVIDVHPLQNSDRFRERISD